MGKYVLVNPYQTDTTIISTLWNECGNANGFVSVRRVSPSGLVKYTFGYYGQAPTYFIRFSTDYLSNYISPTSGNVFLWGGLFVSNYDNKFAASLKYMWEGSFKGNVNNNIVTISGNEYYGIVHNINYAPGNFNIESYSGIFSSADEMVTSDTELISVLETLGIRPISSGYPITYHYTNSTVSGPTEAAVGDTVVVSAVPDNNYGITDPATQILVTNNDVAVEYQWNPTTNTIMFTMPDPS